MVTRSTHIFKTVGSLDMKLDVYTKSAGQTQEFADPNLTVFLYFHGGGLVRFNRVLLYVHIV